MVKLEARAQHGMQLLGWIEIPPAYVDHPFIQWPMYVGSSPGGDAVFGRLELPIKDFRATVEGRPYRAFMVAAGDLELLYRLKRFTPV